MKGLIIDMSNPEMKFHVVDEGVPLRFSELLSALNQVQTNLIRIITEEEKTNEEEDRRDQHQS